MYATAHPSMLRCLAFATYHGWPAEFRRRLGVGTTYGRVADPIHDLPEGTIYLPSLESARDRPDAHRELEKYLDQLGLLAE
jgi:hypothetical protein